MIRKKLTAIFIELLVAFVAIEYFSYLLVGANLLLINETPILYQAFSKNGGTVDVNWWTERDLWGAWHKENSVARHETKCFSAEYHSNSIGARDSEFSELQSRNNFVLLGDSFAEGYGVNVGDTAQKIIEKNTGLRLLNFGSAGNFGPLQYWLVYENLAKNYEHKGLIIFFLPANDFTDNDYDHFIKTRETFLRNDRYERYRPYYTRNRKGEYEYFIPSNAVKKNKLGCCEKIDNLFKSFIIDNFWSANVFRSIQRILFSKKVEPYSGYFDASIDQQEAAVYFIKKIVTNTSAQRVLIISIPVKEDFNRVDQGASRESLRWWLEFKNLENMLDKKVQFIDLIDYKPKDVDSLFFTCDSHWSPIGNRWSAEIVSREILK